MEIVSNLLIGFMGSFIGTIPPGLLNIYAVKVNFREGRARALIFSVGVCITVMIQALLALLFARYIDNHPEIITLLEKIALGIFTALTLYFFFFAKDSRREIKEDEKKSRTGRFFSGMAVAALNILPLPYWIYIGLTFSALSWFSFAEPALWFSISGIGFGTFLALALYIRFSKSREEKTKLKFNMNKIMAFITAGLALITLFRLL